MTSIYRDRARLSSSRSEGLFAGVFARGQAAAAVDDAAWLQAMLDFEAALARACARYGLISEDAAQAIVRECHADAFDIAALARAAAAGGNPAIPLVQLLRARVGESFAPAVHLGATSQDAIDTAAMLIARRALPAVRADAAAIVDRCAELAEQHRDTPMIGRTLLQQALPITFGLKAAGWMTGVLEADEALAAAEQSLCVQLGGAVGTLAGYGGKGREVARAVAGELGLRAPVLPWHGNRVRIVELASALALLSGAASKPARDVTLLAQGEVAEVRERSEGGIGGSSSMPHKHNPIAAIAAVGCAERVPGLLSTLAAAMLGEHERAAGAWHSEWESISAQLRLVGASVAWTRTSLERLEIDERRMLTNLERAIEEMQLDDDAGIAGELVDAALAQRQSGAEAL